MVSALAAGALLYGLDGNAAAQKTAPIQGACQSLWVTAPVSQKSAARARKPLDFSAAEILDLEVQVVVPAGLSSPDLELKLFTPKGHLYQKLALPSVSALSSTASKRKPRYKTVTARIPVAGTTIVNSSLYGTWRVEAYLEGEPAACVKPRTFVIKP
jgi:hypothetical protein